MTKPFDSLIDALAPSLICRQCPAMNTRRGVNLPGKRAMVKVLKELLSVLFPGCLAYEPVDHEDLEGLKQRLHSIADALTDQITRIEAKPRQSFYR